MLNIANAAPIFWKQPAMGPMHIVVVSLTRNEAKMLPFFFRHYERFADEIHIWDNASTDGTRELIQAHPKARLFSFDTKGETRDDIMSGIKNSHYKQHAQNWVIVVDIDELIFADDVRALLSQYDSQGVLLPKVQGFHMVGDELPVDDGKMLLTDVVKNGVPAQIYCKYAVFKSHLNIGYGPGCHFCYAAGRVPESPDARLKLLHYRWWSEDQTVAKSKALVLSEWNKRGQLGTFQADSEAMRQKYRELRAQRRPVV